MPNDQTSSFTHEQAAELLNADLANLVKKVASGKPLTYRERALVEEATRGTKPALKAYPTFCTSQMQLAEVLGMSRQKFAYHAKRPGNPGRSADGRYDVAAWRRWFDQVGVAIPIEAEPSWPSEFGARPLLHLWFEDGLGVAILEIAKGLGSALDGSGLKMTPEEKAIATVRIWSALAARIDKRGVEKGRESYFAPLEDGTVECPDEIVEAKAAANL